MMYSRIPPKIRDALEKDTWMRSCVVAHGCFGKIEWHHAFSYGGKRINEIWSIIPLCHKHHYQLTRSTADKCNSMLRLRIRQFDKLDKFTRDYPRSKLFEQP